LLQDVRELRVRGLECLPDWFFGQGTIAPVEPSLTVTRITGIGAILRDKEGGCE
jgi:hypothetical protein